MSESGIERRPSIVKALLVGAAVLGVAFAVVWVAVGAFFVILGSPFSDEGRTNGIYAQNRTPVELQFRILLDGDWYEVPGTAKPRGSPYDTELLILDSSRLDADACASGPIQALDVDERVVARKDGPICLDRGRFIWVIEQLDPAPGQSG